MNQIQQLINQMCPNGVEWKTLGEVLKYEQPTKYIVDSTDYSNEGTPVLTAGASFILGYTKETNGIYTASKDNPVIIFDDFTTSFHWVNFDFKVKSSAMKMLKPINDEVNFRYVYYSMCTINYVPTEHSRQWISTYSKFQLPVPPLAIQTRIVEILDHFTNLTANLTAELNLRRKQFEHYREKLLAFDGVEGVEWKKLGEVCDVVVGGEPPKDVTIEKDDNHPFPIWGNGKDIYGFCNSYKIECDAVAISSIGANTGAIFFHQAYFTPIIRLKVLLPKDEKLVSRYLYYACSKIDFKSKKSSVPNMSAADVKSKKIPIPPLATQHSIVSILDKFTALIENIEKELALRQKQYEYYREELLRFGG